MYEYRCTQCGHRFEKIQNFSAEPETECPVCHGPLMRPLTAPRLHFKGAGWYVNDYASKSSEPASEGASEPSKESSPSEKKSPPAAGESTPSKPASTPAAAPAATQSSTGSTTTNQ
jgi:putative FmdB family regulatory protein